MITTIFFDWGGVLIAGGSDRLDRYWADILGVSATELRRVMEPCMPRFQLGLVSENEIWVDVCGLLGVRVPTEPLWQAAFRASYVEIDPMLNLARELRNVGYGVGLISNTEKPSAELFLEKMGVDERYAAFEHPVFSCDAGCSKPDPAIFREAGRRHKIDLTQSVLVDDAIENIHAAQQLGMHTIHVADPLKAVDELRALLSAARERSD